MIFKFYKYMYYQSYLQKLKMWGKYGFPEQVAAGEMVFLFILNSISLLMSIRLLFGVTISGFFGLNIWLDRVIFILFVTIVHYLLFIYKNKYINIIKMFKRETEQQRKVGKIVNCLYSYGSLILFFFLGCALFVASEHNFTIFGYISSLL